MINEDFQKIAREHIKKTARINDQAIVPSAHFYKDLAFDELDMAELLYTLQNKTEIFLTVEEQEQIAEKNTVGALYDTFEKHF